MGFLVPPVPDPPKLQDAWVSLTGVSYKVGALACGFAAFHVGRCQPTCCHP